MCSVVDKASWSIITSERRMCVEFISLAVSCMFTAGGAVLLLPVCCVGDMLAVRIVLITTHNHIIVPAVPALLLLLHATVTPCLHGDSGQQRQGLALPW